MAYATDLTTLLSSYGFNNNIKVGCPALWMVDYGNTNDPIDALTLGLLNPAATDIRGYDFTTLTLRAQSFPRGLMWPKAVTESTAGGVAAYGSDGATGWNVDIDRYLNKSSCLNTNNGSEVAYIQKLYFQQDASYTYMYMNLKTTTGSYGYGTSYGTAASGDAVLNHLVLKFPRSVLAATYLSIWCYKSLSSGGNSEQVSWDSANGLLTFFKRTSRTSASSDPIHSAYASMAACANGNLPVGIRIGLRYA